MPGILRGGFVPVAVRGEDFIAGQFGNVGQPVMQPTIGGAQNRQIDLP